MADKERSAANKGSERATEAIDEIQRDLQAMRDDVSRLAQQMASLLAVTGSQAIQAQMSGAKQSLDAAVDAIREKAMQEQPSSEDERTGRRTVIAELPESQFQALAQLAKKRGLTANAVLQQAITTEKYLADKLSEGASLLIEEPNKKIKRVIIRDLPKRQAG